MLFEIVTGVFKRDEFVALGMGKYAECSGQITGNLQGAFKRFGFNGNPHNSGVERPGNFAFGSGNQFRRVNEEGRAIVMSDGTHDVLGPRMLHWLKEDLKQTKLARLQLRERANKADERIEFVRSQWQHEFMRQGRIQAWQSCSGQMCRSRSH